MYFNQYSLGRAIKLITAAIACNGALLPYMAIAADSSDIQVITVTALGVDENANVIAPFSLVYQKQIFERGGTLGDMLNGLPGIHSDSFGGGASRPVVRGQTSPRVKVMSDSSSLLDASDISPDHAVTSDPMLAGRVEVLRGPATLLYGGGAIGGVVNVLDNKIPTALNEDENFIGVRGNTAANERAGVVSFTKTIADNFAVHAEGSARDVDAYEAAGWDESQVDGTFAESRNASVGASWIGEKGFLGLAYSWRNDDYGLPGHNHEYESCHPHGVDLHCGEHEEEGEEHEHEHEEDAHEVPLVDLGSQRWDLRGEYYDPFAGIHRIRLRVSHTDYEHDEIDEGVISTTFRNDGYEGRIEFDHAPLFGWHGVVGAQIGNTSFSAQGAEAFLPRTDSSTHGIFAVEHFELSDALHLEAGARHERQEHEPRNDPRNRPAYSGTANSFSGAAIWSLSDEHSVALTLARAQRLPHTQELYARGLHLATNTYECGVIPHPLTCGGLQNNVPLGKEESSNVELTLRKHSGALTYSLNLFRNDVDDYFYARTLDQHENFRLIKYTQQDAEFSGAEAEVSYTFSEKVTATVFGDYVRAEFTDGSNLPRISPRRFGARVDMLLAGVNAGIEFFHVARQDDIASYEVATPGYNMLNATLGFSLFDDARYEVFVRGNNLLDDEVWNHASFLASVVPQPGRNLSAGFRYTF
jgi:iron complex outermembrane receptor protein